MKYDIIQKDRIFQEEAMRVKLYFDSVKEFGLFICSTAILDFPFPIMPKSGIDLGRCLPIEACWPFLSKVSEVQVANVVYMVEADTTESQYVDYRVVNYMLNDVQMMNDSICILKGNEVMRGSQLVREHIEKLPINFGLREGWRTDYLSYVFRQK